MNAQSIDVGAMIKPKSDQLNADDLIAGPKTITITRVAGNQGSPDQPLSIHFEGDDGKPFKPCKSMRRVFVSLWGSDGHQYVGRSLTLYRDPKVKFGGVEVGGIRISHMSHIDREVSMALTATKAKRVPYTVKPLIAAKPKPAQREQTVAEDPPANAPAKILFYSVEHGKRFNVPVEKAISQAEAEGKALTLADNLKGIRKLRDENKELWDLDEAKTVTAMIDAAIQGMEGMEAVDV